MRRLAMFALTGLLGLPQLRIAVNIPAYRLDVFVDDSLRRSMPVAIGMPEYETPRGAFQITSVEWNPWWNPPDSPWAAHERPVPPSTRWNPMGRVKLNFQPLYFLHGTPWEKTLSWPSSHGCVRMSNQDAVELAQTVLRYGSTKLSAAEIKRFATDTVTTRLVRLDRPVPLDVRYDLVELRGDELLVWRDFYHISTRSMRSQIYEVLAANGFDTTLVDSARAERFSQMITMWGKRAPVDSLMRGGRASIKRPTTDHPHGFTIDEPDRLAFISCEGYLPVENFNRHSVLRIYVPTP